MSAQRYTMYDVFRRNALLSPDAIAVVQDGQRLTFLELWQRIEALAGGIAGLGIKRGERICILAQNDTAYLVLYGACEKLVLIAYPINWRLTGEEIGHVLDRARPRMLVVDDSTLEIASQWPGVRKDIDHWYTMGDRPTDSFDRLATLHKAEADTSHEAMPEDAFAVISTAAVDVIPRGAVLTHANVIASNIQTMACMNITASDAYLVALPMYHIAALGIAFTMLHVGGKNVIMTRFDADNAVRLIDEENVTILSDFPPVLLNVLNAAEEKGSKLPSLKIVTGLDAPETINRLHKSTGAQFWTGFGQSETTGFVTLQRVTDHPGSSGKPAPLCEIKLVDEYDAEVPTGTPGEILVRGPVVFQGYYGQPDVNEYTFRGGWHHTGDVGRFDDEGYLYYVKRKAEKELIKPGGENVYPAEVEKVIMEMAGVKAVCVFGVPDVEWGEAITAVVEVDNPDSRTAQEVIDHVAGRIARFKKPRWVEFTETLPKSDSGETDRDAVKERWGKSD